MLIGLIELDYDLFIRFLYDGCCILGIPIFECNLFVPILSSSAVF